MVLKSDVVLPIPTRPVHFKILENLKEFDENHPNEIALVNGDNHDEHWDFHRVRQGVLSLATFIKESGFQKGEVCTIALPNSCEFPITVLGIWSAGLVASAISAGCTEYEFRHSLSSTEASVVVTEDVAVGRILKIAGECPNLRMIIAIKTTNSLDYTAANEDGNNNKVKNPPMIVSFDDAIATKAKFDPFTIDYDLKKDTASLLFSSGTTGLPKPAIVSHLNYATAFGINDYNQEVVAARRKDAGQPKSSGRGRYLTHGPIYHVSTFVVSLMTLCRGIETYYFRTFNLRQFVEHIQNLKIIAINVNPYISQLLAEDPVVDEYDMSSLKLIMCGAAALAANVIEKLKSKYGVAVQQAYGMTELTFTVSSHLRSGYPFESVGSVCPGLELKFVDIETGKECGPNQKGELRVRGPIVMKGYKNRPEETKEAFDEEGFMRTGDLAYYDENEFIFICQRTKELFKVTKHTVACSVSPAEIENVILGIEGVVDCAVIGVRHPELEIAPRAYVVRNKEEVTEALIHQFVNERVSEYKQLVGGIEFLDVIPRNPTGKVKRALLKESFEKKQ